MWMCIIILNGCSSSPLHWRSNFSLGWHVHVRNYGAIKANEIVIISRVMNEKGNVIGAALNLAAAASTLKQAGRLSEAGKSRKSSALLQSFFFHFSCGTKNIFALNEEIVFFFLLLLLSHLISKLWSPSTPQRSHKGNEIEKLIVDLWMLWEKGRKIVSAASKRTPIFPFPILSLFGTLSLLEQSIRRNFPSSETLEWWQSALVRRWFRINAAGSVTYVTQLLRLTSVGRFQKQRNGIKTNFVYVCEIFNSTWPDGLRLISSRNTFV